MSQPRGFPAAIGESIKIGVISVALVMTQLILNSMGYGGITTVVVMYVIALVAASVLEIDRNGVYSSTRDRSRAVDYLTRSGIDVIAAFAGILLWFIAGLIQGLDSTIGAINKPGETFDISGTNIIIKLIYATISHLTLFSFCQIWVNLCYTATAFWTTSS